MTDTPLLICYIFTYHLLFTNREQGILFVLLETPYLLFSNLIYLRIVPSLMRFLSSCLRVRKVKEMCLYHMLYELVGTDNKKTECDLHGRTHTCKVGIIFIQK